MTKELQPPKGIWGVFNKLSKWLYTAEMAFMVIFTMYIALDVCAAIIMRMLGMQTLVFSDELGRIMLITTTMIGSSMAVRDDGHMTMDTLYQVMSNRVQHAFKAFVYLLCGIFWLLMSWYGLKFTIKLFDINMMMESIAVCKGYTWSVVTFGMFTMGIRYFIRTVISVHNCVINYKPEETDEIKGADY